MSFFEDFEDLDDFTNNEFSTVAVVDSATAAIAELSGIFDENYQDMFGGFDAPTAEGRKFCLRSQSQLTKDLRQGDRLIIYSQKYKITSLQPSYDGRLTNIILKQDLS